jgi:hypothetical protein
MVYTFPGSRPKWSVVSYVRPQPPTKDSESNPEPEGLNLVPRTLEAIL